MSFIHQCHLCQKPCGDQNQLDRHLKTHDPSCWFECPQCSYRCPQKTSLQTHSCSLYNGRVLEEAALATRLRTRSGLLQHKNCRQVADELVYIAEIITKARLFDEDKWVYYVKWLDYPEDENTWESQEFLYEDCKHLLLRFWDQFPQAEEYKLGQVVNASDEWIEQEKRAAQTLVEQPVLEYANLAQDGVGTHEENDPEMKEQLQIDELETHLDKLYHSQDSSDTGRMREMSEGLSKLCGKLGRLPTSYVIKVDFDWIAAGPHSHGAQSDVYQAKYEGRLVAIKEHRWHVGDRAIMKKAFCQEVVYWKRLRHPNIVPFLGIASSARFFFAMVSEWMEKGDIIGYLKTNPSSNKLKMLADASTAIAYMHNNKVIHGDIKGRNVLVNRNGEACLADFGLATAGYNTQSLIAAHSTAPVSQGTLRWSAPERLKHTEDPWDGRPTARGDVYSFGILMWEVHALEVPFSLYRHDWALIPEILKGLRPDRTPSITARVWNLMCQCWAADPMARPGSHDLCASLSKLLERA